VGSKVIYVEIDSQLPAKPEFAFLEKKKYRIKTLKMAGVASQGICFPLSILPEPAEKYELEQDVTEIMGITKYERYAEDTTVRVRKPKSLLHRLLMRSSWTRWIMQNKQQSTKGWPEFIQHTDEDRVQVVPSVLNDKSIKYVVREKVEGQSGTFFYHKQKGFFWDSYDFGVCSRTVRKFEKDTSSYWSIAESYGMKDILQSLLKDLDWVAIQGECVGPKVQGNIYKLDEYKLFVFNLLTSAGPLPCNIGADILGGYGLEYCPLVNTDMVLLDTVQEMLDYATGESLIYPTMREGLVFRNYEKRISFKAVSVEYLLKNEED
jgi:RNA ligase (TIGR02306 family)